MAGNIRGITIEIGGNTQPLNRALDGVNRNAREIQGELRQVERLLKLDPKNTELLAQKQQLLTDAVANTSNKLETLKEAQRQVQQQFERGEVGAEQYRAIQREVIATQQELDRLEDELNNINNKWENAAERFSKFGEKATKAGETLTKNVTLPIMAAGAGIVAVGEQFDDAFDKIRVGTGATGEALEALNDDFRKVAKEVPARFDDISTAIADYNTRLGITGEGLQDLSIQTLELVRITGGDLSKTIEETSQSFQAFNLPAEQYGKALDFIFKTSQSTGIGMDRLQSNLVKFAPALKQLGLDFEESATLMGQLDKAGVDVEQTLSGLTKAVSTMAKEGITDANEAIETLFKRIKEAPNDIDGTAEAMEFFGAKAGPALATAIREGKLEYQDLLKELQNSEETILGVADETADWAEGLAKLKNNLLLSLEPIAVKFFGAINELIPVLQKVLEFIAGLIQKFVDLPEGVQSAIFVITGLVAAIGPVLIVIGKMATGLSAVIKLFGGFSVASGAATTATAGATVATGGLSAAITALTGPIGIAIAAIVAIGAVIVTLWKTNEEFRENVINLWEELKAFLVATLDFIKEYFGFAWEAISKAFSAFGKLFKGDFKGFLNDIFNAAKIWVTGWAEIGKNIVTGVWEGILAMKDWIFDKIGGFFGGLIDSAKGALGINSPSKVFADVIGKNMALGIGVGFEEALSDVKSVMGNSLKNISHEVYSDNRVSKTQDIKVTQHIYAQVKNERALERETIRNLRKVIPQI